MPLVNGQHAFELECSKARQAVLLDTLGLPYPRTRVIHAPEHALAAASELEYPIIVKPNTGGSGALMTRFEDPDELRSALAAGSLELGPDGIGLVQEYHPPRGGAIVRVEALDGRYLYAIRVPVNPTAGFNLCPADICAVPAASDAAADDGLRNGQLRQVEAYQPPDDVIAGVLEIMAAGQLDIGGVEYLESERDGRRYFYDVNALSNFVADAPRVVGFDPFVTFVDFLEQRASTAKSAVLAGAGPR